MKEISTEVLQIRLTKKEKEKLKILAQNNHMSMATYIKVKCLNKK